MVDTDCSQALMLDFQAKNIIIKTNIDLKYLNEKENNVEIYYHIKNNEYKIVSSYCLISTGREVDSNIFSNMIHKNNLNIFFKNGLFNVNKYMQTKVKGFYAIGDCINTPWLAHVASMEGLIAIDTLNGSSKINLIDYNKIPKCVYTLPSISWCGLLEQDISISKEYIKISKFKLMKNGMFSIILEHKGFIKFISDRETNEILGAHIFGKNATELIAEPSFAIQLNSTVEEIISVIHAHPTVYESIYETALVALDKPLHG